MAGGRTYADRQAQEKSYLRFAQHKPIEHQAFSQERYLDTLDQLACEKFNFAHCYLKALVTESENHRLGVGFCNDVECFAKAEGLTSEEAARKVRESVMKDDEGRPTVYENEKRWPRIQAWLEAYNAKVKMDARPKLNDLEYYLYLRRRKGMTADQALAVDKAPLLDSEYQEYLEARYSSDKGGATKTPTWSLKRDTYRGVLSLLASGRGATSPIVSSCELRACLNALRTGYYEDLAEKRRTPNSKIDENWRKVMDAQFERIGAILDKVNTCETFEYEQNRRIRLARDYNK